MPSDIIIPGAVPLHLSQEEAAQFEADSRAVQRDVLLPGCVLVPAARLRPWRDNPRFKASREAADAVLRQSFLARTEAGLWPWDPAFPAIALGEWDKADHYEVKQGNCRLPLFLEMFPEGTIPTRFELPDDMSILSSLHDGDQGLVPKTVAEAKYAVVKTMKRNRTCGLRDISRWLWHNARDVLHLIAPATRSCTTLSDLYRVAASIFQLLFALSLLPDEIVLKHLTATKYSPGRLKMAHIYALVNMRRQLASQGLKPAEIDAALCEAARDVDGLKRGKLNCLWKEDKEALPSASLNTSVPVVENELKVHLGCSGSIDADIGDPVNSEREVHPVCSDSVNAEREVHPVCSDPVNRLINSEREVHPVCSDSVNRLINADRLEREPDTKKEYNLTQPLVWQGLTVTAIRSNRDRLIRHNQNLAGLIDLFESDPSRDAIDGLIEWAGKYLPKV